MSSVFDVRDYTCSTDWEKTSSLIETFFESKNPALTSGKSPRQNKVTGNKLSFQLDDLEYAIYFDDGTAKESKPPQDEEPEAITLPTLCPRLRYLFGVEGPLWVCVPEKTFVKLADAHKVLSALLISANASGVDGPVFIPYGDFFRNSALGVQCRPYVIRYHTDAHPETPAEILRNWSCLWDGFLAGIGLQSSIDEESMHTDVAHSYLLPSRSSSVWEEILLSENENRVTPPKAENNFRAEEPPTLPWGTTADPVREFSVKTQWESIHNEPFEGLMPNKISFRVRLSDSESYNCPMSEFVREMADAFLESFRDVEFDTELFLSARRQPNVVSAIAGLYARSQKKSTGDPQTIAIEMVRSIFQEEVTPDVNKFLASPRLQANKSTVLWEYPPGTLFSLFSHQCACAPRITEGSIGLMWEVFLSAVKECFEMNIPTPHVAAGLPDWGTSVLNQKLQLINYTVTTLKNQQKSNSTEREKQSDGWGFDDDQFEDAEDTPDGKSDERASSPKNAGPKRVGNLSLFYDAQTPLLEPHSTFQAPITSDMMEDVDHATSSSHHTDKWIDQKTQQHRTLIFDMIAFRQTNVSPKLSFLDFVRWYSPADFIDPGCESIDEDDYLSVRMKEKDNLWKRSWDVTSHVAVSDTHTVDIVPAQLAVKWLFDLPSQVVIHLVVNYSVTNALWSLGDSFVAKHIPQLRDVIFPTITRRITELLPRQPGEMDFEAIRQRYLEVANAVELAEIMVSIAVSCVDVLSRGSSHSSEHQDEIMSFVSNILKQIWEAPDMHAVTEYSFILPEAMWNRLRPSIPPDAECEKEYLLRCSSSEGFEHRLLCVLTSNEFLTATAFSEM